MKICRNCNKEFPKTAEYSYRNRYSTDGLYLYCKSCASQKQKEVKRKINPGKKQSFKNLKGGIPKSRLHGTQYKLGQMYEIDTTENERARRKVRGKVIQETNNFIVIESKSGVRECFLKRDFYLGDTIKEL